MLDGAETGLASPVGSDVVCGGTVWGRWCLAQGLAEPWEHARALGVTTGAQSERRCDGPCPVAPRLRGGDSSTAWSDLGPAQWAQVSAEAWEGPAGSWPDQGLSALQWAVGPKRKEEGGREGGRQTDRQRGRERLMSLGEMQHVRNVNIHSNIDLFSENTQGVASH